MDEKFDDNFMDDDDVIIEMTDDEGNVSYFREEMILMVDGDQYALLCPVEEHDHECDSQCEAEDEAFFAKVVLDDDGEESYIEPTDEEFEAVCAAYDKLIEEEEAED